MFNLDLHSLASEGKLRRKSLKYGCATYRCVQHMFKEISFLLIVNFSFFWCGVCFKFYDLTVFSENFDLAIVELVLRIAQ